MIYDKIYAQIHVVISMSIKMYSITVILSPSFIFVFTTPELHLG